jgi:hypothetical protein
MLVWDLKVRRFGERVVTWNLMNLMSNKGDKRPRRECEAWGLP